MNASRIDSRVSSTSEGSPLSGTTRSSGTGRIHTFSGSGSGNGTSADLGRREVHRARPALLAAQHVETDVRHDAVQPRAQRGSPLEPVEALPRPQERFLDGVLRLETGSQHPVGVRGELGPVPLQLELELVRPRDRGPLLRRHLSQPARSSSASHLPTTLRPAPVPERYRVTNDTRRTGRPDR